MSEARTPSELTASSEGYGFPEIVPFEIEAGAELFKTLSDPEGRFKRELEPLMQQGLLLELGVRFPAARIVQAERLEPNAFVVRINEIPEGQGTFHENKALADATVDELAELEVWSEDANNPATGRHCALTEVDEANRVGEAGFRVYDPLESCVLSISSTLRRNAAVFLGIQEATEILAQLEKSQPALIAETVPKVVSIFQLTDVLRRLVEEEVSIRDMRGILYALAEWGLVEQDTDMLTEYVRTALSRQISDRYSSADDRLFVYLLDKEIEDLVAKAMEDTPVGVYLALDPDVSQRIIEAVKAKVSNPSEAVILTTMGIRRVVRKLIEAALPHLAVLSYQEIKLGMDVEPLGRIEL